MKNTSNDPSKGQGTKENKNKTTPIYNKGIRDAMHHVENELNKGNNLIDYFLLMGIEPSICELEDLYELNIKDLNILIETQNRFTEISKDMLKILNELGIVKYTS